MLRDLHAKESATLSLPYFEMTVEMPTFWGKPVFHTEIETEPEVAQSCPIL